MGLLTTFHWSMGPYESVANPISFELHAHDEGIVGVSFWGRRQGSCLPLRTSDASMVRHFDSGQESSSVHFCMTARF